MKRYKSKSKFKEKKEIKEGSKYKYYYQELLNMFQGSDPVQGWRVKIISDSGETKWLDLNSDFMDALHQAVKDSGLSLAYVLGVK